MRGLASRVEDGARAGRLALALALGVCAFPAAAGALPSGRMYEMVSPVYKAGYGANGLQAEAPNGESVVFRSLGVFAGEQWAGGSGTGGFYLARRGSTSWETEAATWSATVAPGQGTGNVDFSSDLGSMDVLLTTGINSSGEQFPTETKQEQFWSRSLASPDEYREVTPTIEKADHEPPLNLDYIDSSADLSHLIVSAKPEESLLDVAESASAGQLYEFVVARGGRPKLVAVDETGALLSPDCNVNLGVEVGGSGAAAAPGQRPDRFNAVSRDGEMVFFTVETRSGAQCAMPKLFARVGGAETLPVSKPIAADCTGGPCQSASEEPAYFAGANEAGNRVFFTTTQPLVTDDTDAANDLYMASIGCGGGASSCEPAEEAVLSLTQVSRSANAGEAAELQNVVSVSPDGSRVYFVARGALAGDNVEGEAPIHGADNLYTEQIGAPPAFVAALCSGPERSGTVKDSRCPGNLEENNSSPGALDDNQLWASTAPEAQTAGSGASALAFTSYGRLVAGDANDAKDVYLYNAADEKLTRVSIGEDGFDANGNGHREGPGSEAQITRFKVASETGRYFTEGLAGRALSEDGSRVIFTTVAPLSSAAVNGLLDLYEWRAGTGGEGSVSLLSSGDATEPVGNEPAISPSGRDVFFVTNAVLVPQDAEGADDVYDARIGGGFPAPPAPARPCAGDACQGPLTNPTSLLVPGSVSQAPGENVSVPKKKTSCRAKFKHVKNQKKRNRNIRRCLLRRKVKHSARAHHSAKKTSGGRGRR